MATQCQCIKLDGIQCTRMTSGKYKDNHFCWQHQNCQKKGKTWLQVQQFHEKNAENEETWKQLGIIVSQGIIDPPWLNLVKLLGPSTFIFYPNINGKRILLLGESPTAKTCNDESNPSAGIFEIEEWLGHFAVYGRQCLDVIVKDDKTLQSTIGSTFELCTKTDQSQQETSYKDLLCNGGVRYHEINKEIKDPIFDLSSFSMPKAKSSVKLKLNYLFGINRNPVIAHNFYHLSTDQEKDRKSLESFWAMIDKKLKSADKLQFLKDFLKIETSDSNDLITILLDFYVLIQLFFDRKSTICHRKHIKNAIVYSHAYDIEKYKKFIELYFGYKPYMDYNTKKNCIELSPPFNFYK